MVLQKQFALKANNKLKKKKSSSYTNLKYNTPRHSQENKMGSEVPGVEKHVKISIKYFQWVKKEKDTVCYKTITQQDFVGVWCCLFGIFYLFVFKLGDNRSFLVCCVFFKSHLILFYLNEFLSLLNRNKNANANAFCGNSLKMLKKEKRLMLFCLLNPFHCQQTENLELGYHKTCFTAASETCYHIKAFQNKT